MTAISNECKAFEATGVGTRVVSPGHFLGGLMKELKAYTFPDNGQGFIRMPATTYADVSCGVTKRAGLTPNHYVVREWRHEVGLFARREFAAPVESLHVVIYTRVAYLADPDTLADPNELARIERDITVTHVIVAVLASAGPKPPVSSHRFVRNLAGGNSAYTPDTGYTLERAIADAKAIVEYEREWATVAD